MYRVVQYAGKTYAKEVEGFYMDSLDSEVCNDIAGHLTSSVPVILCTNLDDLDSFGINVADIETEI